MTEVLTKQQQRDAWDEARKAKVQPPLTEAQIAERETAAEVHRTEVNELLAYLNSGERAINTLNVETPDGPKAFNIAAVLEALNAQCYTWRSFESRQNGLPTRLSPLHFLFPGVNIEKEGEKVIKRHYQVHSDTREVTLTVTRCVPDANGDTLDQPRYEEAYYSTVKPDNLEWRLVVNELTERFPQGIYVHLYSKNFEYIWDYEGNCDRIIPERAAEAA